MPVFAFCMVKKKNGSDDTLRIVSGSKICCVFIRVELIGVKLPVSSKKTVKPQFE